MSNGRCWRHWWHGRRGRGGPQRGVCARCSMPCCTWRGRAVRGACSPASSRTGRRCGTTSTSGRRTGPGKRSTAAWWSRRASTGGARRSPRRRSSTARAARPPKRAGSAASMAEKKINGRKRHYLVDTEGHLLAVLVEAADRTDRDGARWVFRAIDQRWTTLQKIWADHAYNGDLAAWLRAAYGIDLEVVEHAPGQKGFAVLPRRWVVERTI